MESTVRGSFGGGNDDVLGMGLTEELLQETFYQAFLHIDQFEGRSSLYTWLCQIGKNAWMKECRRSKRFVEESWDQLMRMCRWYLICLI